jgi:uncharacterized protein YkwD
MGPVPSSQRGGSSISGVTGWRKRLSSVWTGESQESEGSGNGNLRNQPSFETERGHNDYSMPADRRRAHSLRDLDSSDADRRRFIARVGGSCLRDRPNKVGDFVAIGKRSLLLTNEFRCSRGQPRLEWHQSLADIGADHSWAMATGQVPFGHDGFSERVRQYPFQAAASAENVALSQGCSDPAKTAVDGWIRST